MLEKSDIVDSVHSPHRLCLAPMLEWTDRHFRYFLRLVCKRIFLYTEMITAGAVLHGDRQKLLEYDVSEHPVAVQLGGSDPSDLAECARVVEGFGYDEVNLNIGCPSDRVQSGRFGACLMAEPQLVADCVAAMQNAVTIPVTVKTRIGIDEQDSYAELSDFVCTVSQAGCKTFIIHARKAWLKGLSPKENREIPPLRYDVARQLKRDFPQLEIVLNGGILNLQECKDHLQFFDGVMLGRTAYHNPYLLAEADHLLFGDLGPIPSRDGLMEAFLPYVEQELARGVRLQSLSRHILGLYHGAPGGRLWRRHLSENAYKPGSGVDVLRMAWELTRQPGLSKG